MRMKSFCIEGVRRQIPGIHTLLGEQILKSHNSTELNPTVLQQYLQNVINLVVLFNTFQDDFMSS